MGIKTKVKAVMEQKQCDKCHIGEMKFLVDDAENRGLYDCTPTDIAENLIEDEYQVNKSLRYVHVCNNCGNREIYDRIYPGISWELAE